MTNQVGFDTVAFCPICKKDLIHTITAVEEEKITKVLCKTCKDEHDYQAAREPGAPSPSRAKKGPKKRAAPAKAVSMAEEWEKTMQQNQDLPAKPYTFEGRFTAGEKLDHATFGIGLVKTLVSPNKMEVLFKDGMKLLIWGRT